LIISWREGAPLERDGGIVDAQQYGRNLGANDMAVAKRRGDDCETAPFDDMSINRPYCALTSRERSSQTRGRHSSVHSCAF
jgi:hypothetical protein